MRFCVSEQLFSNRSQGYLNWWQTKKAVQLQERHVETDSHASLVRRFLHGVVKKMDDMEWGPIEVLKVLRVCLSKKVDVDSDGDQAKPAVAFKPIPPFNEKMNHMSLSKVTTFWFTHPGPDFIHLLLYYYVIKLLLVFYSI